MRYWLLSGLLALSACTSTQEPAPTVASSVSSTIPGPVGSTSTMPGPVGSTLTVPPSTAPADTAPSSPAQSLSYQLVGDLPLPVQMTARPGEETSYVITKNGLVWAMVEGEILSDIVLDISDQVSGGFEQGLLSIALHPTDELFYLHYSAPDGDTVVSEFSFASPTQAVADSERVLLRLDQPAGNHNGGMILFHPDGRLLVGLGDGGGSGDRFGNGQNTDTLLGGIVALDVQGDPNPTLYALGLRNPWRFWIDGDNLLYIADVGQASFEEVSVAPLAPDQNFGWPITEGLHCFRPASDCDPSGTVLPALEVVHGDGGTCSITGGVVYRGERIPELDGHFLYSDYCGGYLRSFRFNGEGEPLTERDWTDQVGIPGRVTGFGIDGSGEVYVTTTTQLLKLAANR